MKNICKKKLGFGGTPRCGKHICKRPRGHEGKHECDCGVAWHFEPNPFIDGANIPIRSYRTTSLDQHWAGDYFCVTCGFYTDQSEHHEGHVLEKIPHKEGCHFD